ncbi:MAG: DNA repair protein RadC [Rickettsiales bacterium]|jgi:DNA repair protein RadC|nr:DNA repair protein RadC [Rickettsiales bacterium]
MTDNAKRLSGHRDRVREKFRKSPDSFYEYEVLEIVLSGLIPRRDTKPLAKELIERFGGAPAVFITPYEKLVEVPGIGPAVAVALNAIGNIYGRKLVLNMKSQPVFHDYGDAMNWCLMNLAFEREEVFVVLYLDSGRKLIDVFEHARGTIGSCATYADKIVRHAAKLTASHVIIVHNHPNGVDSFSEDDIRATINIQDMLNVQGADVYDHIVVADGRAVSGRNGFLFQEMEQFRKRPKSDSK